MKINKHGKLVKETSKDLAQAKKDKEDNEARIQAELEAKEAKETKKASGRQKLIDLGLTEEEIDAITN
jgi:hypothetical protein